MSRENSSLRKWTWSVDSEKAISGVVAIMCISASVIIIGFLRKFHRSTEIINHSLHDESRLNGEFDSCITMQKGSSCGENWNNAISPESSENIAASRGVLPNVEQRRANPRADSPIQNKIKNEGIADFEQETSRCQASGIAQRWIRALSRIQGWTRYLTDILLIDGASGYVCEQIPRRRTASEETCQRTRVLGFLDGSRTRFQSRTKEEASHCVSHCSHVLEYLWFVTNKWDAFNRVISHICMLDHIFLFCLCTSEAYNVIDNASLFQ